MKINDSNMEEFGFQDWHCKSHLGPFLCKKPQAYYKTKIPLALASAKNRYISLKYSAPRLWYHTRWEYQEYYQQRTEFSQHITELQCFTVYQKKKKLCRNESSPRIANIYELEILQHYFFLNGDKFLLRRTCSQMA